MAQDLDSVSTTIKVKWRWQTYCTNEPDGVGRLMMMTDYAQLFVFTLYWLLMKWYGFANFVEQHFMPYEYASISLVAIEAYMWLL